MNNLSKKLMCIQIRSGIQLWVEHERAQNLMQMLTTQDNKFIEFDGQIFNRADIVGVFSAGTMAEHTRRKNGEWQCDKATWHKRGETCACRDTHDWCRRCNATPCLCDRMIGKTQRKHLNKAGISTYPHPGY